MMQKASSVQVVAKLARDEIKLFLKSRHITSSLIGVAMQ